MGEPCHLALAIGDAEAARLPAKRLHQHVAVKPALAAAAKAGGGEIIAVQPGKASLRGLRRQQRDIGAHGGLQRVVGVEDRRALRCRGKIEIAVFLHMHGRRLTIDAQCHRRLAQKPDAIERHGDIDSGRKLLPDRR